VQAQAFVRKWGPGGTAFELNECAGAQEHAALDVAVAKGYG